MTTANDHAEAPDLGPATVSRTSRYRLRAKTIDQEFLIQVAWPPGRTEEGQTFPVVYVLDGNSAFTITAQIARSLQSGPFPMPPTLVVGIGYHFETTEAQAQIGLLRVRDLTPCSDALLEAQYPDGAQVCGGATAFLDFIEHEVKPFVASRFPVDAADQTLVGSSLAGLFTLHTLFAAPQTFLRYVAVSPAIYWGEGRVLAMEEAYAATAHDLPAHLFLAAGSLEEGHDAQQRFVSNTYQLDAKLRARAYPKLGLTLQVFDGETHMSVYFGAVARGLGAVFGGYRDMHNWSRWLRTA
ncbi:MAG TPA: alpha/beta hydrolase-fold protein [Phenylobacterium sp.]|jgi:hypothetical protein|nr:alpha/beta hydrolase-fold protein [Phenylobacterium sp.]